jgi:hypothetical protein
MQSLETPTDRQVIPPVVKWYKLYCMMMVLVYLLGLVGGVALLMYQTAVLAWLGGAEVSAVELTIRGIILVVACGVMLVVNIAALFLPRQPWVWIYHLVNIALGLSGCCALLTIPLLIFWLKPEVQQYFGRSSHSPPEAGTSSTPPPIPHV